MGQGEFLIEPTEPGSSELIEGVWTGDLVFLSSSVSKELLYNLSFGWSSRATTPCRSLHTLFFPFNRFDCKGQAEELNFQEEIERRDISIHEIPQYNNDQNDRLSDRGNGNSVRS